jgi:hypothetical protein
MGLRKRFQLDTRLHRQIGRLIHRVIGRWMSALFKRLQVGCHRKPGFARKWYRHLDFAIGAVKYREPVVRVTTAQELLDHLLGLQGKWPVRLPIPGVVGCEKPLAMIDQDSPKGTLMEFSLLVKWSRCAQGHSPALSHLRRQEVNWVRPNLFVWLTLKILAIR